MITPPLPLNIVKDPVVLLKVIFSDDKIPELEFIINLEVPFVKKFRFDNDVKVRLLLTSPANDPAFTDDDAKFFNCKDPPVLLKTVNDPVVLLSVMLSDENTPEFELIIIRDVLFV